MAERRDPSKSDAWIERVGPDEAEGKLAEAYERISREAANDAGG